MTSLAGEKKIDMGGNVDNIAAAAVVAAAVMLCIFFIYTRCLLTNTTTNRSLFSTCKPLSTDRANCMAAESGVPLPISASN